MEQMQGRKLWLSASSLSNKLFCLHTITFLPRFLSSAFCQNYTLSGDGTVENSYPVE